VIIVCLQRMLLFVSVIKDMFIAVQCITLSAKKPLAVDYVFANISISIVFRSSFSGTSVIFA
jgi:hypothetical protein